MRSKNIESGKGGICISLRHYGFCGFCMVTIQYYLWFSPYNFAYGNHTKTIARNSGIFRNSGISGVWSPPTHDYTKQQSHARSSKTRMNMWLAPIFPGHDRYRYKVSCVMTRHSTLCRSNAANCESLIGALSVEMR